MSALDAGAGLLVALGAAVGSPLRLLVGHHLDRDLPRRLPWGTLAVNLVGSLVLGVLVGAALDGRAMALLGTGFCGGLTTYSAFAVQGVRAGGRRGAAYVVLTVGGCLAMATLGHLAATALS